MISEVKFRKNKFGECTILPLCLLNLQQKMYISET